MDSIVICEPRHTPTTFPKNPWDAAYNVAVRHMAMRTCPSGWDQVKTFDEAPTTLATGIEYANKHGRLCIAEEDSDGTLFDCADTNHHLRAWHDSVHFRHKIEFTVAGEAAAVYVQVAQLYRVYGVTEQTKLWASVLLADIIGLVLHYQRTRKWPKNKRAGTLNERKRWVVIADEIADKCQGKQHEFLALDLAKATWGGYHA